MMPMEGANLENLLERVVQMNMLIIAEMQEQRKQMQAQQSLLLSQLSLHASTTTVTSSADSVHKLLNPLPPDVAIWQHLVNISRIACF